LPHTLCGPVLELSPLLVLLAWEVLEVSEAEVDEVLLVSAVVEPSLALLGPVTV